MPFTQIRFQTMEPLLRLEALAANDSRFQSYFGSDAITVMPNEVRHSMGTDSIAISLLTKTILGHSSSIPMKCRILGCDAGKLSGRKQRILLRQLGLIDWHSIDKLEMSLQEFVSLPLKIAGLSQSRVNHMTKAMLSDYDLLMKMHCPVQELSLRDQRRAVLAQALIKAPRLVIARLGENTLDRDYLLNEISRFCSYGAGALILSTMAVNVNQPLAGNPMELADVGI